MTGLLVPPRDVAALRAALERLLADEGLRTSLGSAAREQARTSFMWGRATEAMVSIYGDLAQP